MECFCGKFESLNLSNKNIIKSKYEMIDMQIAYEKIKDYFIELDKTKKEKIINITLEEINSSHSYISAEILYSFINVPPTSTSMMDGYGVAISEIDFNSDLIVCKKVYAGDSILNNVDKERKNKCIYVTTGSPLPPHIDCVIPIELVEQLEYNKLIRINSGEENIIRSNKFIRHAGSDIKRGDVLLDQNKPITLHDLGILASAGINRLDVYKLPKIGIISTGDELIDLEDYTLHKKFVAIDTNRMMLKKLLKEGNGNLEIVDYGIIPDNLDKIEMIFTKAISENCDMLISSGGVSMGERDFIKIFLENKGDIVFGRLNMKPGKPTTFGKFKNLTIFGLPGNPVSCIVCYYLLVEPAIKMFQSPHLASSFYHRSKLKAKLLDNHILSERPEYTRSILYLDENSTFYVESTGDQRSSRMNSFKDFNCLMCLPAAYGISDTLLAGDLVDVLMIENDKAHPFLVLSNDKKEKYFSRLKSQVKKVNKNQNINSKIYTVGTITISDRAYKGEYAKDLSTEELKNYFSRIPNDGDKIQYKLLEQTVIADVKEELLRVYQEFVEKGLDLIVTSGGTGLTKRDITNEVTKNFIDKEASGVSTYIITESLKITKFACLSNPVVGIKENSLIVTLPGSPKAIKENLSILENILPHVLNQVTNIKDFH